MRCEICEVEAKFFRCDDHKRCDGCGSTENLCYYGRRDGELCQSCRDKQIEKRVANFHGDTRNQSLITCPFCGCSVNNSWEITKDTELECDDCGREFSVEIHAEITYSTRKIKLPAGAD